MNFMEIKWLYKYIFTFKCSTMCFMFSYALLLVFGFDCLMMTAWYFFTLNGLPNGAIIEKTGRADGMKAKKSFIRVSCERGRNGVEFLNGV